MIPDRVPLGFVCGYPTNGKGELYGGSMFMPSAANDTPQSKAIQKINERWGADFRRWNGRETIGIPVCKKKYAPFQFKTKRLENGVLKVVVVRMYGCICHSHLREKVIRKHGERKGWEPFGQWSLSKAQVLAKKVMERSLKNIELKTDTDSDYSIRGSSPTPSDDETTSLKQICNFGKCAWKYKHKYDDISEEMVNNNTQC